MPSGIMYILIFRFVVIHCHLTFGIGYDVLFHNVSFITYVLRHPGVGILTECRFRDHGGSRAIRIVLDFLRSLGIGTRRFSVFL